MREKFKKLYFAFLINSCIIFQKREEKKQNDSTSVYTIATYRSAWLPMANCHLIGINRAMEKIHNPFRYMKQKMWAIANHLTLFPYRSL